MTVHRGEPDKWPDLFKQGKLHVVCVAAGGFTTCDFVASTLGGMKQEQEVWPLTQLVNQKREVGTFWPRMALTVLPQLSDDRDADLIDIYVLERYFADVAEVNREYIKLPDVLVDLNSYLKWGNLQKPNDARYKRAISVAVRVLGAEPSIHNLWIANMLT